MSATFWIAFWWSAFVGTHMVLSSLPVRGRLVAKLGEKPFLGIYSLVAFATFVPLVSVYLDNRHAGGLLWALAAVPGIRQLAMLLAVLGVALTVAAVIQPSPALAGINKAAGSRGRYLLEGAKVLKIMREEVPVKARVVELKGFSGHADAGELLRWADGLKPKSCFLVHGEPDSAHVLADRIHREKGWLTTVPELDQVVDL